MRNSEATQLKEQETDRLDTPTRLSQDAVAKISDVHWVAMPEENGRHLLCPFILIADRRSL